MAKAIKHIKAGLLHKVIETKFLLDAYGKTWLAYRRKPEEGTT